VDVGVGDAAGRQKKLHTVSLFSMSIFSISSG
jgi:hypothetical protein